MTDTTINTPRRGRPPMQPTAPVETVSFKPEIQADAGPRKSARKPFGSMNLKLAYKIRAGFHGHWFNETSGRIQRAQEAGYEHVKEDGKPISKVVGAAEGGGPLTAFLMEIPEEWYKEDMAVEQNRISEKEASLKRGAVEGAEGGNQYVPAQGITIR